MGHGRVFSREFKLGVVRQVAGAEKRPAQACREHGLAEGLRLRWRRECEARGEAAFAPQQPSEVDTLQRRIADLARLCGQLALEHATLKKALGKFSRAERHTMIAQAQRDHPGLSVHRLCALLGIGRSWYYGHPGRAAGVERDVMLRDAIERIVPEFPGYGYRRITKTLQREGWTVNLKRVLRVMRQGSLLCRLKRRFVITTDAGHALHAYPNVVADCALTGSDQV